LEIAIPTNIFYIPFVQELVLNFVVASRLLVAKNKPKAAKAALYMNEQIPTNAQHQLGAPQGG
tara:strand:+ start:44 stop:232 length:189 start_codon:yes stop_codon:yes gene_type:complete